MARGTDSRWNRSVVSRGAETFSRGNMEDRPAFSMNDDASRLTLGGPAGPLRRNSSETRPYQDEAPDENWEYDRESGKAVRPSTPRPLPGAYRKS